MVPIKLLENYCVCLLYAWHLCVGLVKFNLKNHQNLFFF